MPIPTLPTDNLYKFISLTGLWITLLSVVGPSYLAYRMRLRISECSLKIAAVKVESDRLHFHLDLFEKDKSTMTLIEMREKSFDIQKLNEENRVFIELDGYLIRQLSRLVYSSIGGIALGVLMTYWGFSLWYDRTQKPLDDALVKSLSVQKVP